MNTSVLFLVLNPEADGLIIYWQGGYSRVMNVASYSVQDLPKTGTFETNTCTSTKMWSAPCVKKFSGTRTLWVIMLRSITNKEIKVNWRDFEDFLCDGRLCSVGSQTKAKLLFADTDLFCYECDKTFKAVSSYRRHMRDYHGDSNTQVVIHLKLLNHWKNIQLLPS